VSFNQDFCMKYIEDTTIVVAIMFILCPIKYVIKLML
jgi:hypothetical protein